VAGFSERASRRSRKSPIRIRIQIPEILSDPSQMAEISFFLSLSLSPRLSQRISKNLKESQRISINNPKRGLPRVAKASLRRIFVSRPGAGIQRSWTIPKSWKRNPRESLSRAEEILVIIHSSIQLIYWIHLLYSSIPFMPWIYSFRPLINEWLYFPFLSFLSFFLSFCSCSCPLESELELLCFEFKHWRCGFR